MLESKLAKKIARIEVRVDPEVKSQFSDVCQEQGSTTSEVIRNFVYRTLNNDTQEGRAKGFNKWTLSFLSVLTIGVLFIILQFTTANNVSKTAYGSDPQILKYKFVFSTFDLNKDGVLTLEDLEKQYQMGLVEGNQKNIFGQPFNQEKFKRTFKPKNYLKRYDVNQDKQIKLEEFIQVQEKNRARRENKLMSESDGSPRIF